MGCIINPQLFKRLTGSTKSVQCLAGNNLQGWVAPDSAAEDNLQLISKPHEFDE